MPLKANGVTYYYNLEVQRSNPRNIVGEPGGTPRTYRAFDQADLCKKFSTVSDAGKFGMCKALSVQWVKRSSKREGFWSRWLTSTDDRQRQSAEATILQMSKNEVIEIDLFTGLSRGETVPGQVDAVLAKKKQWHTDYLTSHGLTVTAGAQKDISDAALGGDLAASAGYNLVYLESTNGTGHCIAVNVMGTGQGGYLFDPNFGEYPIPGGFKDWADAAGCLVADYTVLLRLHNLTLAKYRLDSVGGVASRPTIGRR